MPDAALSVVVSLRKLHSAQCRSLARHAREAGVSPVEFNALAFALERGGITPKDLAYELELTAGSVTALADRLEHVGYLVRERSAVDRRSVVLTCTETGVAAVMRASAGLRAAIGTVIGTLGAAAVPGINEFLGELSIALHPSAAVIGAAAPQRVAST